MKKIVLTLCLVIAALLGGVTNICAKDTEVVLDKNGKLNVDEINCNAFDDMAPGDTRTEKITVKNNSTKTQNFYISQNTISTLEECNCTEGAAYKFDLLIGEDEKTAVSMLLKEAGGYDSTGAASSDGLAEIEEIENYTFFETLKPQESTNLYITLYLNGEGNDINYANAVAKLQLGFKTDTYTHGTTTHQNVSKNIVDIIKTNPIYRYVKTGDTNNIWIYIVIALVGVGMFGFVLIRKIKNKRTAKNIISMICVMCTCAMLFPADHVMASQTVSVTFRAGDAGYINESVAKKMVKDDRLVDVNKNYIRIKVSKDRAATVGEVLYAGFGISDADVLFGSVTSHEGYTLLPAEKWGFDPDKKIKNNAEYVLDYGVLVDPVMYTIRYVDVDSYDSASGKYTRQISAPYINYGNAGDYIEMNAALVESYASAENKCSFNLERGKDNGYTFFYAYTGSTDGSNDGTTNTTYETAYRYLTQDQIITINTASANNSGPDTVSTGYTGNWSAHGSDGALQAGDYNGQNDNAGTISASNNTDRDNSDTDNTNIDNTNAGNVDANNIGTNNADNPDTDNADQNNTSQTDTDNTDTDDTKITEITDNDTPHAAAADEKDVTFLVLGIFSAVTAIIIATVILLNKFGKKR